jgi:hypothetical protein
MSEPPAVAGGSKLPEHSSGGDWKPARYRRRF